MGRPGLQTWTLFVLFSWMHVAHMAAGPYYWAVIPGVLESGHLNKMCLSVIKPNETLRVTVTLTSEEQNVTIHTETAKTSDIHSCVQFLVPTVEKEKVVNMEVEVQGINFYSKEVRKVMIRVYKPLTFVQTDKPIYLPGQKVQFRVVSIDTKFRPVSQLYNLIELEDANGNRVGQWLNQSSNGRILQLEYALNSECVQGSYKINVDVDGERIVHWFKVEKYVLPKFEVTIESKDEVSIIQDQVEAKVCAKYTFGQPVPGLAKIKVCRSLGRFFPRPIHLEGPDGVPELIAPCHEETKQTDATGCATFTIEMSTFTKPDNKVLQDRLVFSADVEEEGTGITLSQSKTADISYVVGRLSFFDTATVYERGEDVVVKIKAVYYNDTPMADMPLHVFEGESWVKELLENVTTNSEGIAEFTLCTIDYERTINLEVSTSPTREHPRYRTPRIEHGDHSLSLAQEASSDTKTTSGFEVKGNDKSLRCGEEEEVIVKYTIVGEAQGTLELTYLILSKGVIITSGLSWINILDGPVTEGELSIRLLVDAKMSPFVQIIVFAVLPSETVIASSYDFETEKCFSHKVSLEFCPSSAVPGEEVGMKVTADPNSLCGVSAIDKSVLLQEPGKSLDADKIFGLLPVTKVNYLPYQIEDEQECFPVRAKRFIRPPYHGDHDDAHTVFKNVGLKIATNLFVRMPSCLLFKGRQYHRNHFMPYPVAMERGIPQRFAVQASQDDGFGGAAGPVGPEPVIETVRTFFPETWIWELVDVGFSGKAKTMVKVPDTITTWETETFCLSDQGFGLAPRLEFTVFQPFFLELTMPYSIVREEHFELKATVFNYLSTCIMVDVIAAPSTDYTLNPIRGIQYGPACLCGNQRRTVSWTMLTTKLGVVEVAVKAEAVTTDISCNNEIVSVPERGRIDLVKKTLKVKAEGIEVTENTNWLLCPKDRPVVEHLNVQLPANVIVGSSRATVSVLGDIMGRALRNIDKLLRMPYGCGEQNMALLAPNIYILEYLKSTDQLTPAIKEKSDKFLTSGYQRQLNYKHANGAYSTFGSGRGNTWLTAFVLRTFVKAQAFIFIEPNLIQESKTWLDSLQSRDGCFQKVGKLFNNRLKGGVSDEVTLTAYITAAFLEMNSSVDDPVVQRSLACLRASVNNNRLATLSNTYTTALMAYVFTLAGDTVTRGVCMAHLDSVAVTGGNLLYWNQQSTVTSASVSVEIGAYYMLALLSHSHTVEDLGRASSIVRWLTKQQNHYGGFSSTQDTVVALQALALYSSLVSGDGKGTASVIVTTPGGTLTFQITQHNKLLYQERELENAVGQYQVTVAGKACAVVQLSVHYNIPTPEEVNSFTIKAEPNAACNSGSIRPKLKLPITVKYNGTEDESNMVIVEVNMLSGFYPDPDSLTSLMERKLVERYDDEDKSVLELYIEKLPKLEDLTLELVVVQEFVVQNLKPAVVKIYDYYLPDHQAETEYSYPCASG